MSQFLYSLSLFTKVSYKCWNLFTGVLVGLYAETSRIFLFLHFSSII